MINQIYVENLKSIDKITVAMKNLNLLVGTNSSGKSTLIQAILLASQNFSSERLELNGNLISLGDYREVRNFNVSLPKIVIDLKLNNDSWFELEMHEDQENNQLSKTQYDDQLQVDEGLYYLSASRIGHLDIYDKNIQKNFKFGLQGEYCLSYFEEHKKDVLDGSLIKDNNSITLEYQVNYWFKYIIGGGLTTQAIPQTDKIKANFIGNAGMKVRTKNIGSGLSYLISILIICLSLEEERTLIIENPEIHLHPRAQARLAEFFIFIAKANRQLIIETHSDHIFNGVRAGIAVGEINKELVGINFLSLNDNNCTINETIQVGKRGRIINPPKGLFDQFDIDLNRMLGL